MRAEILTIAAAAGWILFIARIAADVIADLWPWRR